MSAHVVAKIHIDVLVRAALDAPKSESPIETFKWWRVDEEGEYAGWRVLDRYAEQRPGTEHEEFYTPSQLGQILVSENVASVCARYPNDDPDGDLPGPNDAYYIAPYVYSDPGRSFSPGEVFSAIDYLDYQSCEHDGWRRSEAFAFLEQLREAYCRKVDGYEDAPWGFDRLDGGVRR